MNAPWSRAWFSALAILQVAGVALAGNVVVTGELKQWHKLTLTVDGPQASETDSAPNPFLDYRLLVRFTHQSGEPTYRVPGYFAADGRAAESSASAGNKWRAHLSPDKPGRWTYAISFEKGSQIAIRPEAGEPVAGCDGLSGSIDIAPTDKTGRDFRAAGRLQYVGQRYLRFAGNGEYFLKFGPDSPETLLGTADFDGTISRKTPLKTWKPHRSDWRDGNPTWQNGKGKGLIGALNYIAGKGANSFSFLTYNADGDGDNVWPFVQRDDKLHYDCSKLEQWQVVFDHAQAMGLYLHFKLQETENDDNQQKHNTTGVVKASLDGGDLGVERKLYCRELVARFAHELALNWNLGEENTQSPEQQRAMAAYIRDVDPYAHHIVIHTYPGRLDAVYPPLLGEQSVLTGASLQQAWNAAHQHTVKWIEASRRAGKPWVVAYDEQGPATTGVPADPGYAGRDGIAGTGDKVYDLHGVRKYTLWGNLMAGGAGVEYYFGYEQPEHDLRCEDWRSRDQSWNYGRVALAFFRENSIPFWTMENADGLVGNPLHDNSRYCLARPGEIYVVYLPTGGEASLDLTGQPGAFRVTWYDPRGGGELRHGSVEQVLGGRNVSLGLPPAEPENDWVVLVRR